jgi:hypothetical protein
MSQEKIPEKLLKAMQIDEQTIQHEYENLTAFSKALFTVRVRDPTNRARFADIKARMLKDYEISEYTKKLRDINPQLATAKDPKEVQLTPEENDKLTVLWDEFISKATSIPKEKLTEIGNQKIRAALLVGILRASVPSEEEIAELGKFRGNE